MDSTTKATSAVLDTRLMARAIELSRSGSAAGELPFGSVIAKDGEIIAEATNRAVRDGDISHHAEILAIAQAQKALGGKKLAGCTLYSNVEPCPMCAFCAREAGVDRVVFALASPVMGGMSHWNILRDDTLSDDIPFVFGPVPEVVAGVLVREAEEVWREWNPIAWQVIKLRGFLAEPAGGRTVRPAHRPPLLTRLVRALFGSA